MNDLLALSLLGQSVNVNLGLAGTVQHFQSLEVVIGEGVGADGAEGSGGAGAAGQELIKRVLLVDVILYR